MTRGRRRARRTHPVARAIGTGVAFAVLALVAVVALAVIVVPLVGGATALTVLTSSMEPKYPPGSLIVVRPVEPDDIRIGDVITYQIVSGDPTVVTHRVVGITVGGDEPTFRTQGDNNARPDSAPVLGEQIQGRLWYSVPLVGWANIALTGPQRAWLVPLAATALFIYAGWMFMSAAMQRRRARRRKASRADRDATSNENDAAVAPLAERDEGVELTKF